jgi:hypothetical protein
MINSPADDRLSCNTLKHRLRNCRLSLDLGTNQAEWGFFDTAAHEVYLVEQEINLICRSLLALASEPSRKQLSAEVDLILIRLRTLRLRIYESTLEA